MVDNCVLVYFCLWVSCVLLLKLLACLCGLWVVGFGVGFVLYLFDE